MARSDNRGLANVALWVVLIGFVVPGAHYLLWHYGLVGDMHWVTAIALPFFGFWGLVGIGVAMTLNDVTGAVQKPREVHHYHRVTIDQNGNAVEVTDYQERH